MKTFKIILILSVFGFFLLQGCSENINPVTGYYNSNEANGNSTFKIEPDLSLLWSNPGLSIVAKGERFVCANADLLHTFDGDHNILVSYDGWATPDTSCYISSVFIKLDNINLHIDIGATYINGHHEYELGNIHGERLRFAIMLWYDDDECNSSAMMKISDVKVYSY